METLRVLVVDDEEGMRLGIERALRDFTVDVHQVGDTVSFEIEHAATGEEGLEKIESCNPHILLLDNKLPGVSGIEVLEKLSDEDHDVLTIMITAYASIETAVKATKSGAYDFLAKPFTPIELKSTVRKAAEHVAVSLQAKKLAEERRQVRFQFISVLAHELKSPINAVESYLQIMMDRSAGDDPKVYDHMVERSLTRIEYMRKLIIDLLDMTRIESGQRERDLAPVNITELAEICIDSMDQIARDRGIALHLETENDRPFLADQSEIEIVLNNLVSNAVKYNKDNGKVDVHIEFRDGEVHISVSDTGIGLTEEEREQLFQDFVRIKKKETKNILGSGLGLSIVKKIVDMYEGKVTIESEPGKGTTFRVLLREPGRGESA
jgi:signal transduction histidine kinase